MVLLDLLYPIAAGKPAAQSGQQPAGTAELRWVQRDRRRAGAAGTSDAAAGGICRY